MIVLELLSGSILSFIVSIYLIHALIRLTMKIRILLLNWDDEHLRLYQNIADMCACKMALQTNGTYTGERETSAKE